MHFTYIYCKDTLVCNCANVSSLVLLKNRDIIMTWECMYGMQKKQFRGVYICGRFEI